MASPTAGSTVDSAAPISEVFNAGRPGQQQHQAQVQAQAMVAQRAAAAAGGHGHSSAAAIAGAAPRLGRAQQQFGVAVPLRPPVVAARPAAAFKQDGVIGTMAAPLGNMATWGAQNKVNLMFAWIAFGIFAWFLSYWRMGKAGVTKPAMRIFHATLAGLLGPAYVAATAVDLVVVQLDGQPRAWSRADTAGFRTSSMRATGAQLQDYNYSQDNYGGAGASSSNWGYEQDYGTAAAYNIATS
eukprot:tig00000681_g3109.t1